MKKMLINVCTRIIEGYTQISDVLSNHVKLIFINAEFKIYYFYRFCYMYSVPSCLCHPYCIETNKVKKESYLITQYNIYIFKYRTRNQS